MATINVDELSGVDFTTGVQAVYTTGDKYTGFLTARKHQGTVFTQYMSEFTTTKRILKKIEAGQDGRATILTEREDRTFEPTFYILGCKREISITITGMNDMEFQKSLEGYDHLSDFIIASAAHKGVNRYHSPNFHSYTTFHAQTRVLTPANQVSFPTLEIPNYLDPEGLVADRLLTQEFLYTEENYVSIKALIEDGDNRFKIVDSGLQGINIGSLVELGVSLRVLPSRYTSTGPNKFLTTRLESILVVDDKGSYEIQKAVSSREDANRKCRANGPAPSRKRKRNLYDQDVSTAEKIRVDE
ncbi:hypothetical protein DL96DRAFT_1558056 [Flagelloscypha sp. PMI_526]|nr:hypothetical protein DL96DRAFT_1558056 [Flagelloscypha sp. PMI_526]